MSFAAHLERNSGRATPFLRRVPNAHHIDNANPAGFHLTEARSCSDKPHQLCAFQIERPQQVIIRQGLPRALDLSPD